MWWWLWVDSVRLAVSRCAPGLGGGVVVWLFGFWVFCVLCVVCLVFVRFLCCVGCGIGVGWVFVLGWRCCF